VNPGDEGERLPPSIGGLIGFALRGWAANAPLYLGLQLFVFAAYGLAEWIVPAASPATQQGQFKEFVLMYTGVFADALVVTAVALGIAARTVAASASPGALMGTAIERWLPVIAVSLLAQSIVYLTGPFTGLGTAIEPRALQYAIAPFVWILCGILGLAAPLVALAADRRPFSVLSGFVHAFTTSMHRANLVRLCVLALVTMLPVVLQVLALDALVAHHVVRQFFWGNVPIDVLTVGPVAAVQTAFALDFARRAGQFDETPP
jgi:hypothetical protein